MTDPKGAADEPQEPSAADVPSSFTDEWYDPRIVGHEEKGGANDWEQRG